MEISLASQWIHLTPRFPARKEQEEWESADLEVVVYLGPSGSSRGHACFSDQDNEREGYQYMVQAENKVFFNDYDGQNNIVWWV